MRYLVGYLIGLNRLAPVRLPKLWRQRQILPAPPPDPLTNLRHQGDLARGEGERRVVGRGHEMEWITALRKYIRPPHGLAGFNHPANLPVAERTRTPEDDIARSLQFSPHLANENSGLTPAAPDFRKQSLFCLVGDAQPPRHRCRGKFRGDMHD
jgi:hypothetical protein